MCDREDGTVRWQVPDRLLDKGIRLEIDRCGGLTLLALIIINEGQLNSPRLGSGFCCFGLALGREQLAVFDLARGYLRQQRSEYRD